METVVIVLGCAALAGGLIELGIGTHLALRGRHEASNFHCLNGAVLGLVVLLCSEVLAHWR